jgi:putative flippase GtrA
LNSRRAPDRTFAGTGRTIAPGMVSVVVPTRNEAGNVRPMLDRLATLRPGLVGEVLFVDDSDDDTPRTILACADDHSFPVRLLHRDGPERATGLAGAVVHGIRSAVCDWVCVIDGDLQHPPEAIDDLMSEIAATGAEIAVGTRYADGGDHGALGALRTVVSRGSTVGARCFFPRALSRISDPMSGFFVVRRDVVDVSRLRPRGFKILLEILVRHPRLRRVEVPYRFAERRWGETKASLRQGLEYLGQLVALRGSTVVSRPSALRSTFGFACVGLLGIAVNQAVLVALVEIGALGYLAAAIVATQVAIGTNFALCDRVLFRDARGGSVMRRFGQLWLTSNSLLLLGIPLLALLVSVLGVHYAVANLLVIAIQFGVRLLVSDRVIWPVGREPAGDAAAPAARHLRLVANDEDLDVSAVG